MENKLYESISDLRDTVDNTWEDRREIAGEDLSALVTGRTLRETKREPGLQVQLVDGRRYGFLTLHRSDKHQGPHRVMVYRCECDCGGHVYLSRAEIDTRARLDTGCMGFECNYGPDEVKAWHNPQFALWLQLLKLLKTKPQEVDNAWGGQAYEGLPTASTSEGSSRMAKELLPLVVEKERKWWLSRKNPALPFAKFNIALCGTPRFDALGGESRFIIHGNILYSVVEIAGLFGLPLRKVKEWRGLTTDDVLLMERIIKESRV